MLEAFLVKYFQISAEDLIMTFCKNQQLCTLAARIKNTITIKSDSHCWPQHRPSHSLNCRYQSMLIRYSFSEHKRNIITNSLSRAYGIQESEINGANFYVQFN